MLRFSSLIACSVLATGIVWGEDVRTAYQPHVFESEGKSLPYRLLAPARIEAGKTYPLVVFFHGAGERGTDNEKQLVHGAKEFLTPERREKYPCFVLVPQCPNDKRWVEVDWGGLEHRMPEEPSEPMQLTFALLDRLVKELPVDTRRIYVTGLSMGGFGTWDAIQRRPEFFAAAVPVCGGGDERLAEKIAHVPVWAAHGDQDTAVKPSRTTNMIAALEKSGGKPKLSMYAGVGHNSWSQTYASQEFFTWMFAQTRPE